MEGSRKKKWGGDKKSGKRKSVTGRRKEYQEWRELVPRNGVMNKIGHGIPQRVGICLTCTSSLVLHPDAPTYRREKKDRFIYFLL